MQNEREHGTERSARAGAQVSERLAEAHLEDKDARAAEPARAVEAMHAALDDMGAGMPAAQVPAPPPAVPPARPPDGSPS